MKVLIACEESQEVCKAFRLLGHEAFSCDTQQCSGDHPEWHIQDSIWHVLCKGGSEYPMFWDLIIAHPPCTFLTVSNTYITRGCSKYTKEEAVEQRKLAKMFFMGLVYANCDHIAIENPIGIMSTHYRKPDQIIQPFQFGHPESKSTCLWLKGLPKLKFTDVLQLPESGHWNNQTPSKQNKLGPSAERSKLRSKTYPGIAKAMAEQWSEYILKTHEY